MMRRRPLLWALFLTTQSFLTHPALAQTASIGDPGILAQFGPLRAPEEGLWSIGYERDGWPAEWVHGQPASYATAGPWKIATGEIGLKGGVMRITDRCRAGALPDSRECVRRWKWEGEENSASLVLSIRWQLPERARSVLPGILYHGNPSVFAQDASRAPVMRDIAGQFGVFEEHRFGLPFVSAEWASEDLAKAAAYSVTPSMVEGGGRPDLWWSLGIFERQRGTEFVSWSGPIGYNEKPATAKAYQRRAGEYRNSGLIMKPGQTIEKHYRVRYYDARRGDGFRPPLSEQLGVMPSPEGMPRFADAVEAKTRLIRERWIEDAKCPGFNMYEHQQRKHVVMGWAGQGEAPAHALIRFARSNDDEDIRLAVRSLDCLITAPISADGFPVRYAVEEGKWSRPDPISQGQALLLIGRAIEELRRRKLPIAQYRDFLARALDVHAAAIRKEGWKPLSTAEAFSIAPLALGYRLYGKKQWREAALIAAEHYAKRHRTLDEPYWGGTLDAKGEDKEGAWAAMQGYLAAYDLSKDRKWLDHASHAADVLLSYIYVWDVPMPPGPLNDAGFRTSGMTGVSPQNQHLDVYAVVTAPSFWRLGQLTGRKEYQNLVPIMLRSASQLIDERGSQGEQMQQTNYSQRTQKGVTTAATDLNGIRGDYVDDWTVLWIATHFTTAAVEFENMKVDWRQW